MATTTARKAAWILAAVWALAAAGLGSVSARAPLGGTAQAQAQAQREFDYLKLSLQWPGTICASTRHCCASNGCCRYVRNRRASHQSGFPSRPFLLHLNIASSPPTARSFTVDWFFASTYFVSVDARPDAISWFSSRSRWISYRFGVNFAIVYCDRLSLARLVLNDVHSRTMISYD
jgi:hypothetical protein